MKKKNVNLTHSVLCLCIASLMFKYRASIFFYILNIFVTTTGDIFDTLNIIYVFYWLI